MSKKFENFIESDDEWFSDIELKVLDLERGISEWRDSRTRELAESARRRERERDTARAEYLREREAGRAERLRAGERELADSGYPLGRRRAPTGRARPSPAARHAWPVREERRESADERTRALIDRGRRTAARRPRPRSGPRSRSGSRRRTIVVAGVAGVLVVVVCVLVLVRGGPSWPASVAVMKAQIAVACQNPNVASEPAQVNFACGKDTSQVLWVFALLTSGGDPRYADARTGRRGLEPITPAQGGQIAWSLNLHHPYDPASAADSLAVAARAINNIAGGATLTSASGAPAVQPGLESSPANCARYTGSAALITRAGFPALCASPVTSREGQAALAADVYRQWMTGASAVAAADAAVLFQNSGDPGDPQVQAILKTLPGRGR